MWGFAPLLRRLGNDFGFVGLVIWGSVGLYVATLLLSGSQIRLGGLFSFLAPSQLVLFQFGASGAVPVFGYDRWWTVVSAAWLHAGLLHIGFNMMWVRQLGPATAGVYGPGRMIIIYFVSGVVGFVMSSVAGLLLAGMPSFLRGALFTVGASAPIFGLLGALIRYGHRTGSSMLRREVWGYALPLFIFGFLMPGVDNFAHAGGFLGGYLAGSVLDPLKPEKLDHVLGGIVCLLLVVASIVASLLHGFRLLAG